MGRGINMLEGPLWSNILKFAFPVAFTAILEQLFNASDVAVVGNFASGSRNAAVAAVGANGPVISLVLSFFIGIALGVNVLVANALGRKAVKEAQRTVHTALTFAALSGAAVAVIGEMAAPFILHWMQMPEDVFPLSLLYLRIYFIGLPVILLYNFEAAIYRSMGDAQGPLRALFISGALNVVLNLFFVIVFDMTVNGVAIATVLSNCVSAGILLYRLVRHPVFFPVKVSLLGIHGPTLWAILKIGLPSGIQGAVFSVANIVIQGAINSLGTLVMAGSSAAFNLEIIVYDLINAFNQACTTFVGQNFGARQLDRCRKILKICLGEGAAVLTLSIALTLFTGRFFLSLFSRDPQVIEIGYIRLLIIFSAYYFCLTYEVLSGYLRGFKISALPAALTTIGVCGVRFYWVFVYFPTHPTFADIMYAYPASLGTTALFLVGAVLYCHPARRYKQLLLEGKWQ